jgi:hypothetical protein
MNKLCRTLLCLSLISYGLNCLAQNAKVPFRQIERDAQFIASLNVYAGGEALSRSSEGYSVPSASYSSSYMRPSYKQPRVLDSKYLLINGLHLGMAALDIGLTQHCIATHRCREGNPLMPSSLAGQVGMDSALVGSGAFISFRLKKADSKLWWLSPVAGISAHTAGVLSGFVNR